MFALDRFAPRLCLFASIRVERVTLDQANAHARRLRPLLDRPGASRCRPLSFQPVREDSCRVRPDRPTVGFKAGCPTSCIVGTSGNIAARSLEINMSTLTCFSGASGWTMQVASIRKSSVPPSPPPQVGRRARGTPGAPLGALCARPRLSKTDRGAERGAQDHHRRVAAHRKLLLTAFPIAVSDIYQLAQYSKLVITA